MTEVSGGSVISGMKVWGAADYVGANPSRWVVIYPHYLDSKRKQVEGRKIPISKAVESPSAKEVFEAVRKLGLKTQLEMDKSYARDCWVRGRVRIELVDESKTPVNPEIPTRQALFIKVAQLIPKERSTAKSKAATKPSAGGAKQSSTAKKSTKKKGKR